MLLRFTRPRALLLVLLVGLVALSGCSEDEEALKIDQEEATAQVHANVDRNFRGLADAIAFLATSQVACDSLNALPVPQADTTEPLPGDPEPLPEGDWVDCAVDLDANAMADDIVAVLNEQIFVDANVESSSSTSITYRLNGGAVCGEPDPEFGSDCQDTLDQFQPRLRLRSYDEGNFDVDILIGSDMKKVATVEIYQQHIAVEIDLGQAWNSVMAFIREQEPQADIPGDLDGVIRLEMVENAARDYTIAFSVVEQIDISVGPLEGWSGPVEASVATARPLSSIRIDGNTETLTANMALNPVTVSMPGEAFGGSYTTCTVDPNGGEVCDSGTEGGFEGQMDIYLAGLTGELTLNEGAENIQVTGLGLGDDTTTASLNGQQLLAIDLNGETGRTVDLTLSASDAGLQMDVQPSLTLFAELAMSALGADATEDMPAWMLNERMGAIISGATPSLLFGSELEVLSGKLELTSNAANVTVEAGQCLVDVGDQSNHPFMNLEGGECGQTMTPDPAPEPDSGSGTP